ncbi:MAG: MBL fold metallo-hydrolase, partial [Candidatus Acidiferrales bacterium]
SVLVVDSESVPSAAREVIADIKNVTNKPVKYLVITHSHGDHFQGADAYVKEWPGVEVISSSATRESIEQRGIPRMKAEILELPARIEKLRIALDHAGSEVEKQRIQDTLSEAEAYYSELQKVSIVLPPVTVDESMTIHSKSRTVRIFWAGKAHTDGDLFVYVPDAKVIATGDALHAGPLTLTDASPSDWVRTLDTVERLDFDLVIGGHGEVIHGKETFEIWKQYLTELMTDVAEAIGKGESLDDTKKTLGPILMEKYNSRFSSIPTPFSHAVNLNIDKAYRVAAGPLMQQ